MLLIALVGCDAQAPKVGGTPEPGGLSDANGVTASAAAAAPSSIHPTTNFADLTLPPIATFADRCARCHGPSGMFYGDAFADLSDEALHEMVHEMMVGPGGLKPTPADEQAMVDYHRALRRGEPLIVITNAASFVAGEADTLAGEVSPDATLTAADAGGAASTLEVDGGSWSLPSPEPPVTLTATRGEQTTRVQFQTSE